MCCSLQGPKLNLLEEQYKKSCFHFKGGSFEHQGHLKVVGYDQSPSIQVIRIVKFPYYISIKNYLFIVSEETTQIFVLKGFSPGPLLFHWSKQQRFNDR